MASFAELVGVCRAGAEIQLVLPVNRRLNPMRRMLAISVGAALALAAASALADEAKGKIENIDTTMNTFQVGDQQFQWSSENSLGPKLKDLKEGDQVKVMYETDTKGKNSVMSIEPEK
jgi:hypothetical protein